MSIVVSELLLTDIGRTPTTKNSKERLRRGVYANKICDMTWP